MTDTYRKIAARLTMFRPQIDLTKYFAEANPEVGLYGEKPHIRAQLKKYGVAAATNTLDGVTFLAKDWEALITALRIVGNLTQALTGRSTGFERILLTTGKLVRCSSS
jgi:hypothetical protein